MRPAIFPWSAVVMSCLVACGEGELTTSALPSRPLVPDPVHPPPVLEATEQIVPGPGMPAEYVADNGISNNNLDVVRHDGRVYMAVRNGIFHYASPKTKMYVFSSVDQRTWELETKIELGRDVREPRFLSHGGRLFLYFAALGTDRFDFEPHGMLVTERLAPGKWTIPRGFYRPEAPYVPWRVRTLGGRPYMLAYEHGEHEYDLSGIPITIEFLTTDDGLEWRPVDPAHRVVSSGGGSETDFAFDDRGDLYAVIRNEAGDETGWGSKICFAPRDRLGEWTCNHDPRKYDSPWVFAYGGEIFLIGRRNVTEDGNFELRPGEPWSPTEALRNLALYSAQPKRCALWQVDRHSLTVRFIVDLPSRGDTCFASVLPDEANPKRFLVYNYSSPIDGPDVPWNKGQDGQTNIYRTPITLWLRALLRPAFRRAPGRDTEHVFRMFAELLGRSCFSFLDGGSLPAEMVERAHALGLGALAIADRDGLYGMARAWAEQKKREKAGSAATRLIVGADLTLGAPFRRSRVALLVQDRDGYTNLCRLLTEAHRGRPKGEPLLDPSWLAVHPGGLVALLPSPYDPALAELALDAFGDRAFLAVHRHLVSDDRRRSDEARALSERTGLGVVATGRPLYHDPSRRPVHDVLTCIRLGITLDDAGTRIAPNAEAFLRSEASMRHLFRDEPAWVDRTVEIASSCRFTMAELRYRFPSDELCPGETADAALARQVEEHLPWRYPDGVPAKVRAQLEKELALIARLEVAPYFLSVLAIVDLARERGILCQGRGSAANSAVCYVLGITSVDPARSSLLFERFLSAERNEPPDIDVDFEHERREEVIQEIYRRYGRDRAAMVSEVIRYRERSALREVGKAFGLSDEIANRMTSSVLWGDDASLSDQRLREVGLDPRDSRVRQTMLIAAQIQGFPRHLSVHVGGFVLSSGPLSEVAPIEPARMVDRTVVQWDKDDLDVLGFFKVDVLALGMLTAIRKALEMIASGRGRVVPGGFDAIAALAAIPPADPAVYDAFCKADTVGVFQIESRAQMSMLPNLRPRTFYDLVIEVAIVRPGPIQGGMVHPYLRRRAGKEPAVSPHACLEPILDRTLGVPLFQEQVMQIAITGAGYTGGEADELRRDMAAWKRSGALERHREKLLAGFRARGIEDAFGEALFKQIQGFGEYGFPESHAASFALLVYASGYLKVHHPAAFVCALIDSQPMGFYSPSALVQDAQRHGVEVRPVRLDASDWDATLEWDGSTSAPALGGLGEPQPAVRLGMRLLRGFSRGASDRIVLARAEAPFSDVDDLWRRARPNRKEMDILAEAGALAPLVPAGRREALWRARAPRAPGLFERIPIAERAPRLPPLSSAQQLSLDYEHVGLSVADHPMRHLRPLLPQERLAKASELATMRHRSRVAVAGLVQSRQRPGTASGVVFVTLEDETGSCNIVLWARVFERYRQIAVSARVLHVKGVLEREGTVVHVIADELLRVDGVDVRTSSRDFH